MTRFARKPKQERLFWEEVSLGNPKTPRTLKESCEVQLSESIWKTSFHAELRLETSFSFCPTNPNPTQAQLHSLWNGFLYKMPWYMRIAAPELIERSIEMMCFELFLRQKTSKKLLYIEWIQGVASCRLFISASSLLLSARSTGRAGLACDLFLNALRFLDFPAANGGTRCTVHGLWLGLTMKASYFQKRLAWKLLAGDKLWEKQLWTAKGAVSGSRRGGTSLPGDLRFLFLTSCEEIRLGVETSVEFSRRFSWDQDKWDQGVAVFMKVFLSPKWNPATELPRKASSAFRPQREAAGWKTWFSQHCS